MKTLLKVLVIFLAVVSLLPLGFLSSDEFFSYSHIKASIESVNDYDDQFITDISRLGLYGQVLTFLVSDGYTVSVRAASRAEYEDRVTFNVGNRHDVFISENGTASFVLLADTGSDFIEVTLPTPFIVNDDDYELYSDYVERTFAPISLFVNSYNFYLENIDNSLLTVIGGFGIIAGALYAIIFILVTFFFDLIVMLWVITLLLLPALVL